MRINQILLKTTKNQYDIGLVILRLSVGSLMAIHGIDKLSSFSVYSSQFSDPIGLGSKTALGLVILAEFIGGLTLCLGLLTRFFSFLIFVTMAVAVFVAHGQDPFAVKELAFLFFLTSFSLMVSGAGNYSVDAFIDKKVNP
ncbi:DoxX family protein [Telluribacter sp. SYSU D00476]|uniref:DoxX family protein n=1 Tax=Telluribacter sp. SYSU D00476 TaxID=2811430 RepID=UPI001FF3C87D|nr:DoxX family protein [Telluribacter sp. SYSU D00476]